jgi:hypothetical protein
MINLSENNITNLSETRINLQITIQIKRGGGYGGTLSSPESKNNCIVSTIFVVILSG